MAGKPRPRIEVKDLERDQQGNYVARFDNGVKLVMSPQLHDGELFTSMSAKIPESVRLPERTFLAIPNVLNPRSKGKLEVEWTV